MIAALFVEKDGCYDGLPGVDAWTIARDARLYAGPHAVVAHPPCQRWGRYWSGGPSLAKTPRAKTKGDDGGCFAAALTACRAFGGVIEHPEASHAWAAFRLTAPPKNGGWVYADFLGGWTCCVEQGHYGHAARKATWLYAFGVDLPSLKWGASAASGDIGDGFHSGEEARIAKAQGFRTFKEWRARQIKTGICQRLSKRQRLATPVEFRDLLLSIASTAQPQREAA
jgi:hypothetical protein